MKKKETKKRGKKKNEGKKKQSKKKKPSAFGPEATKTYNAKLYFLYV